jgi:outer membrane lipoprotein
MRRYSFLVISAILAAMLGTGSAHVISEELRRQVPPGLTFKEVMRGPAKYQGSTVLWAGAIIRSTNTKEGTLIEVLEKPLGHRGQPKDVDVSEGRFLILHPEYLDTAIYAQEREITVAGTVIETRTLPLGEIEYRYPVIAPKEMHLWKREEPVHWYPYWPYNWWGDPWWPYWPYHPHYPRIGHRLRPRR